METNPNQPGSTDSRTSFPVNKYWGVGLALAGGLLLAAFLAIAVLKAGSFFVSLSHPIPPFQLDFGAYYVAATVLNSDQPLYDEQISQKAAQGVFGQDVLLPPYIYPPLFAWLLRPLARIPYSTAVAGWLAINILLTALTVRPLARLAGLPPKWYSLLGIFVIIWVFPLTSQSAFSVGQVNLVLLFLFAIIAANLITPPGRQDWMHDLIIGLAVGCAAGIKLYFVVLVPLFWFFFRRRAAVTGAVTFLATVLIGAMGAGIENTWVYFSRVAPGLGSVSQQANWINYSYTLSQSIERMFRAVSIPRGLFFTRELVAIRINPLVDNPALGAWMGIIAFVVFILLIGWVLIADWRANRKNQAVLFDLRASLLILATMLCIPLSWSHSFVLALVPIAILVSPTRRLALPWQARAWTLLLAMGLIFLNLHWNYLYALVSWPALPFWILLTGTLGILILVGMLCIEIIQDRTMPSANMP